MSHEKQGRVNFPRVLQRGEVPREFLCPDCVGGLTLQAPRHTAAGWSVAITVAHNTTCPAWGFPNDPEVLAIVPLPNQTATPTEKRNTE